MMAPSSLIHHLHKLLSIFLILITLLTTQTKADCESESHDSCNNKAKALPLKIIAIFSILATSMIGICLPLCTKSVPVLSPENDVFIIIKCFAAGIILGTGFMHVLPDSFEMLWSDCLKEKPWHEFPFSGLVAMFSALITLMIDSLATSIYSKKYNSGVIPESSSHPSSATLVGGDQEMANVSLGHFHGHQHHNHPLQTDTEETQLLRYRVIAMVLELGIVVHSVVIGLGMGASNNTCSIKGLIAAMCFHQMFEGMGLGGCILQAEYKFLKKAFMVFFFSVTTPFGIALGIGMSRIYKENSPSSLITVGLLNASSAGLLIYMALCDLLSADFMGPRLQSSIKLQIKSHIAAFLGAGGMSLMAKWA